MTGLGHSRHSCHPGVSGSPQERTFGPKPAFMSTRQFKPGRAPTAANGWLKRTFLNTRALCHTSACMKPSVIVWDLETVPDLARAANDLVGKSDIEVREAIGDKFPKHIYHSIVCIDALIAHWEADRWAVDAVGAPTWVRGPRNS